MKTIKVSAGSSEFSRLLLRQTSGGSGVWKDCKFIVNQPVERCDWWVVCHGSGLRQVESTFCDPNHIVYISMEPTESVGHITEGFLNQFSHLVLCDRNISHPNIRYANGLTWWVGMTVRHQDNCHHFSPDYALDYDLLKAMQWPQKKNRISVIVSKKNFLDGHKRRIDFINKIKELPIGKYIDIFGGGFNPIPDKWDAITPYKYHIVMENDMSPDYWTEKLADAFLGFSFPIYAGCPNITEYFSRDSLLPIDIGNIQSVADTLMELIKKDPYEKHVAAITMARNRVLDEYNIFQMMTDICRDTAEKSAKCNLKPNSFFFEFWLKRAAHSIGKIALPLYRKARRKQ